MSILWNSFSRIDGRLSLNSWKNLAVNESGPRLYFPVEF